MRVHDFVPAGASGNADIFGRSPKAGERVIDLEVDTYDRPPGLVVLRETTVVAMAKKLGYHVVPERDHLADMAVLNDELERLRDIEKKYHTIQEALVS